MHEAALSTAETGKRHGDEHDGLGKDDRHHTGCIDLQRYVLTGAAVLAVAYDALGILHGHLTCTLHKKHE